MSFTINLDSHENRVTAELFTEPLRGLLGGRDFTNSQVDGLDPLNNQDKAIYEVWQRALIGILLFTVALPYTVIAAVILVIPPIHKAVAAYFADPVMIQNGLKEIVKITSDDELKKPLSEDEKVKAEEESSSAGGEEEAATSTDESLSHQDLISCEGNSVLKVGDLKPIVLEATKGQKKIPEAVTKISWWGLMATTINRLIFNPLVPELCPLIFSNLDFRALQASCCVSKGCNRLVFEQNEQTRQKVDGIAFGKTEWKALGLDIGDEPLIPPSLVKSLDEPDPVDPNQTVGDTHMLVLVPADLTLKSLGKLVKSRFPGSQASGYRYIDDRFLNQLTINGILNQLSIPNEKSYWVLMKKDVIPGSRSQRFEAQEEMVATFAEAANVDYVIPTALEAAVCILTHEFKSGERRERLFGDNPLTYTRCQELVDRYPVCVGGFAPAGLIFLDDDYHYNDIGVAVLRRS